MDNHSMIRKCIACGTRKSKVELLRLVKNKDQILVDPRGNLPGRGAYICPDELCIDKAQENNLISDELKTTVSEDFYNDLMGEIGNE